MATVVEDGSLPGNAVLQPNNPKPEGIEAWVRKMGVWDQQLTPELLAGPSPLPMPVKIAERHTLTPVFQHLQLNGNAAPLPEEVAAIARNELQLLKSQETNYNVPFIEYEKGVIYADKRLDLCKMVLGPSNIEALLDSLETNTFVKHFLLGNNIIGPTGARRIAKFLIDYPERMDTWYLAGNCIDAAGARDVIDGLVNSVATNVWLKRNPLTSDAAKDLARLITESKNLRTLDLDQTGLGDAGVAQLFGYLLNSGSQRHCLQHLYLNGNGIGVQGSYNISLYLTSSTCGLQSLFLSNNPIGDAGATSLAQSLSSNNTIERLTLASVGMTAQGASRLLRSLSNHKTLISLDIGQSYATKDLGTRYNWIDDDVLPAFKHFILFNPKVRYLELEVTAMSPSGVNQIRSAVLESRTLCWFNVATICPCPDTKTKVLMKRLKEEVRVRLTRNVAQLYNGSTWEDFQIKHKRGFTGPEEDVRKTDSVYRNRDAGLARRGLKILDKFWDADDTTLQKVMAYS